MEVHRVWAHLCQWVPGVIGGNLGAGLCGTTVLSPATLSLFSVSMMTLMQSQNVTMDSPDDYRMASGLSCVPRKNGLFDVTACMCGFYLHWSFPLRFQIVAKKYRDFEFPPEMTGLWRYLDNAYARDEFTNTCPADREIEHAYSDVAKRMK